ncbi:uncharacterized protein VP01_12662g1 [Puccinia sorghi]|uniref:Uncharacterized protein n=1 Tax=Puccinia sorghi TaxID=27349 RepID=A0A0L6VP25_9BASI|nr:uncharacterized protein VP01_12662g1 [Puccinia sorghi]
MSVFCCKGAAWLQTWMKRTKSQSLISAQYSTSPQPLGVPMWPIISSSEPGPSTPAVQSVRTGVLATTSRIPPCFSAGMVTQSPHKPCVATMGSAVKDPIGIAFSKKKHASKILPCHKDLTTD